MKRSREPEEDLEPDSQPGDAERFLGSSADLQPVAKITGLDLAIADEDEDEDNTVAMKCALPPHKDVLTFSSYPEYEVHYSKVHTNRCLECRKNFPTEFLLGVHIEEFHDPLAKIRRDKGEHTYSCFVESCDRKCLTHQKRRMHMIDKHMYPKNFFFAITKEGVDGRRSLLNENGHHRRRSSTAAQSKETRRRANTLEGEAARPVSKSGTDQKEPTVKEGKDDEAKDTDMADLAGAMSALQFVPHNVKFGRGRAGFAKN